MGAEDGGGEEDAGETQANSSVEEEPQVDLVRSWLDAALDARGNERAEAEAGRFHGEEMTDREGWTPYEVPSDDVLRMVGWANEIAKEEWAPDFGKQTTIFWFKDEKHAEAFSTAFFLRIEVTLAKRE